MWAATITLVSKHSRQTSAHSFHVPVKTQRQQLHKGGEERNSTFPPPFTSHRHLTVQIQVFHEGVEAISCNSTHFVMDGAERIMSVLKRQSAVATSIFGLLN
jgi:hypothetical protein